MKFTNKKSKPLPNFILDQLSMRFGLKTLAIKNVISMKLSFNKKQKSVKSLKNEGFTTPYTQFLMSLIGIDEK